MENISDDQLRRNFLFTPCDTKEALHNWIIAYLDIDLPDSLVDPQSTSTAMSVVWEVYDKARKNDDEDFNRILAYASRDSAKTLSASILEVLMVLHLQRNVAHMAAIEQQARKAQYYTKGFFNKPILREFVTNSNERRIEVIRYENVKTGENLTAAQWKRLLVSEKDDYKEVKNYIQIIIATVSGCNAEHVSFMCVTGDTKLIVSKGRTRKYTTARGVYQRIKGKGKGGNPKQVERYEETMLDPVVEVRVLSLNLATGCLEFKPITYGHRRRAIVLEIRCKDRKWIKVTSEHPLYVSDKGFLTASELSVGMQIVSLFRSKLGISEIESIKTVGEEWVYDFTVADNHNFFGNNLLNHNCVDEVDIVSNPAAYEESKAVPSPFKGQLPITLLTSTRKYSFGLVQKEIDEAAKTGLIIRHWNVIDVTQACAPERHRPDLPKIPIYRSDDLLHACSANDYASMSPDQQQKYVLDEGYEGCLSNCKIFAQCQGRLATKQTSHSKLLKPISDTINKFRATSLQFAKSQLLCWKPSSEGLIYSRFDRDIHMLSVSQMAEMIVGEPQDPNMTKGALIQLMKSRDIKFYAGMDWGFSHCFAMVLGARDGNRMFVIDAVEVPELELSQKLELCETKLKPFDAAIFPDPAYPSDIKTFKRNGYRMRDWSKLKGSVTGGIEIVRLKLWPTVGEPQLYFLRNDDGCELLAQRISSYHWQLDSAGRATEQPSDEDDDALDALRYMVMNVFAPKGSLKIDKTIPTQQPSISQQSHGDWMNKAIADATGRNGEEVVEVTTIKGKKGSFLYDL